MNEFQRLIMLLKIQYHNMGILHRYLSGDFGWFENHEEIDDWKVCIAKQIDEVCEEAQALGYTEPSLKDALLAFGGEEISPEYRGSNETFRIAARDYAKHCGDDAGGRKDVPASVANKLQEMEYKWNKIADYKLARVLGDNLQKKEI